MGGILQPSDVALDTMPNLLARNAQKFGDSPACREKILGYGKPGHGRVQRRNTKNYQGANKARR